MAEAQRIYACEKHGRTAVYASNRVLDILDSEEIDCPACELLMGRAAADDATRLGSLLETAHIDIKTLEAEHCDQRAFNAEKRLRRLAESRLRDLARLLTRYDADCDREDSELAIERLDQAIELAKAAGADGRGRLTPPPTEEEK